jgi:hypothetical protein
MVRQSLPVYGVAIGVVRNAYKNPTATTAQMSTITYFIAGYPLES